MVIHLYTLYSNQQRDVVAVTIRGSVLFYLVAVLLPFLCSVTEFWYLYTVVFDQLYSTVQKCAVISFDKCKK